MPTYAELTHDLLKDAATFLRTLAEQNETIRAEMNENAAVYERIAETLKADPTGAAPTGLKLSELAAKLLRDTAVFYRKVGLQNEPIREQLEHNANIYEQIADSLVANPVGVMD
jgi:hypothetical protein